MKVIIALQYEKGALLWKSAAALSTAPNGAYIT